MPARARDGACDVSAFPRGYPLALWMLTSRAENTEMNANRVLVGSAMGALLLGLAVLEVMSQRVRVDQPTTAASDLGEAPTDSWPELERSCALGPIESRQTEAVYLADMEDRFDR
jgi:hypothetical protein